jgi:hypothetical protein
MGSQVSVVGIATGYGLDDRGVGVRVPVGSRISFLRVVQTGSGAHPTSYPMVPRDLSPGVKRPGRETYHSPQTSAELKKRWIYTSTPHTPSWRMALGTGTTLPYLYLCLHVSSQNWDPGVSRNVSSKWRGNQ